MAIDLAKITLDVETGLIQAGASPASPLTAVMAQGIAQAIVNALKAATVTPTLLVAPTGGGPVTGTGTLT